MHAAPLDSSFVFFNVRLLKSTPHCSTASQNENSKKKTQTNNSLWSSDFVAIILPAFSGPIRDEQSPRQTLINSIWTWDFQIYTSRVCIYIYAASISSIVSFSVCWGSSICVRRARMLLLFVHSADSERNSTPHIQATSYMGARWCGFVYGQKSDCKQVFVVANELSWSVSRHRSLTLVGVLSAANNGVLHYTPLTLYRITPLST